MASFIYETHMHTSQASACGKSPGKDYIQKYIDAGYSGIIITDHFFRGNCGINKNLPWEQRVHLFCQGYEDAKEAGYKVNFPVFFGWEEYYDGDEFLVYGIDKEWMLKHPEMENWTRLEQYQQVHLAGGCVVQAHPFRERDYIKTIHLSTRCVDAVEGVNSDNSPECNGLAVRYAKMLGLPITGGSDNHCADTMQFKKLSGVVFETPLRDIHDYVSAILNRKPFKVHAQPEDMIWHEDTKIHTPVKIHGEDDRVIQGDIKRFLRNGEF